VPPVIAGSMPLWEPAYDVYPRISFALLRTTWPSVACPTNGEPAEITMSCSPSGSRKRLVVASMSLTKPRPLLPTIGVLVVCAGGSAGVSLGEKLRGSPAAAVPAGPSADPCLAAAGLVADSPMKRGVGM
jgi:hypothetical protein